MNEHHRPQLETGRFIYDRFSIATLAPQASKFGGVEKKMDAPEVSKKEEGPEEIDLATFQTLGEDLQRSQIEEQSIVDLLTGKALTASAVQKKLGVNYYATIYGRLDRMSAKGLLLKKYMDGKRAFYTANPNPPVKAEE